MSWARPRTTPIPISPDRGIAPSLRLGACIACRKFISARAPRGLGGTPTQAFGLMMLDMRTRRFDGKRRRSLRVHSWSESRALIPVLDLVISPSATVQTGPLKRWIRRTVSRGENRGSHLGSGRSGARNRLFASVSDTISEGCTVLPARRQSRGTRPLVARIVQRLRKLGHYQASTSDVYDSTVAAAVSAYQQTQGLVPDGEVGPKTYRVLFSTAKTPSRTFRKGAPSPTKVGRSQRSMSTLRTGRIKPTARSSR